MGFIGPSGELSKVAHDHDLGPDTDRGCSDAPTQPQHRKFTRPRQDHLQRLVPPHPVWDEKVIGLDVVEPVSLHLLQDPVMCILERD